MSSHLPNPHALYLPIQKVFGFPHSNNQTRQICFPVRSNRHSTSQLRLRGSNYAAPRPNRLFRSLRSQIGHPSHWGRICFLSTPDGEHYGLVKNLASMGLVSTVMLEDIQDKFIDCGMEKLINDSSTVLHGKHKIFMDGDWVGTCEDSASFEAKLRHKCRRKQVPQQVEVKRDKHQGEVRFFTDAGRILRPLLVVENLRKVKALKAGIYSFETLLSLSKLYLLQMKSLTSFQKQRGMMHSL